MRYTALYVDSLAKWAVVDTLSDVFVPGYYETERAALEAARLEEARWSALVTEA